MTASEAGVLQGTVVLFDWNGTIVLDHERARAALNAVLGRRGHGVLSPAEFAARFRLPMAEMFTELGIAAGAIEAEVEWNEAMTEGTTTLRPGALAALNALHDAGATLGVVSAAARAVIEHDCATLGIPELWRIVKAPSPDKLATLLRHRPGFDRAYYVGDTVYDLWCARKAGYAPIGVYSGYSEPAALRAEEPEALLGSLDELVGLVLPSDAVRLPTP